VENRDRKARCAMLRRWLAFAVAGIAVTLAWYPTGAYADGGCPAGSAPVQTQGGVLCVVVTDPGAPGNSGSPGNPGNGADPSPGCFKHNGVKVPCVTELGVWWSGSECYAERYNAPPGSPAWQGHSDGSLWMCSTCVMVGTTSTCHADVIWLAPGQEPGPPDPGQLASVAVGVMPLARADVRTAPQTPDHTYIGVENWLWVPRSQWKTLAKTVTAGGTSVTVRATPRQVVWNMGPAKTRCYSAGVAWRSGMTDAANTSCGYTYESSSASEPNGVFAIAATIRYDVEWTCRGACSSASGTLGLVDAPAGAGALRVLQRQTVVVR